MRRTITHRCGERTCAESPGVFCRFVRTRSFGRKFECALYDVKLDDGDDHQWLQRCEECLNDTEAKEGS